MNENIPPSRWTEKYEIRVFESDALGRLKTTSLCDFFQDAAWKHFSKIDSMTGPLLTATQIWVLTRMEIEFYSCARWQDIITVETWPTKMEKITAYREFKILDKSGQKIAAGVSSWAIVDMQTRKLQRLSSLLEKWPAFENESALNRYPEKINETPSGQFVKGIKVSYSDYDVNRHVNNVKYIGWMTDLLPMEFLENHEAKCAEINFMDEAMYGDDITASASEISENVFVCNIIRSSDNKELCRGRFAYKDTVKTDAGKLY